MKKQITVANAKDFIGKPQRIFLGKAVKGVDSETRTIRAYVSTKAWDRYGERFEADAFKDGLGNFKKNPVILFGHDYSSPPIAKAIGFEFDANGLILTMKFADTDKAKEVFALYEGGFMSAFSVGFRPLEVAFEERIAGSGEMGAVFVRAELLENSAVPVPANPEAVVIRGLGGKKMTIDIAPTLLRSVLEGAYNLRTEPAPVESSAPAVVEPEAVVPSVPVDVPAPSLEPAPEPAPEPALAPETAEPPQDAPKSLKAVLGYLLTLGKAAKEKGDKLEDAEVRSLAVQANNILRELVLGVGAEPLNGGEEEMTDAEAISLVREYEMLSEKFAKSTANEKDRAGLITLGKQIEMLIQNRARKI